MLVHAIGNAPSAQFATPPKDEPATPVLRDKVFGLPVDRDILFTNDCNDYQAANRIFSNPGLISLYHQEIYLCEKKGEGTPAAAVQPGNGLR